LGVKKEKKRKKKKKKKKHAYARTYGMRKCTAVACLLDSSQSIGSSDNEAAPGAQRVRERDPLAMSAESEIDSPVFAVNAQRHRRGNVIPYVFPNVCRMVDLFSFWSTVDVSDPLG
jgi:hypothetical protein